jgi:enoyl-CoA hydratase/carnithine racemase
VSADNVKSNTDSHAENNADDLVLYGVKDHVATLTLHNPAARNGWSTPMEHRYFALLDQAEADPDVRVIVVTGHGKTFCPGLDITRLKHSTKVGLQRDGRRPILYALGIRKPMLAAINGAVAGVGLIQSLVCDLRFAARGARMSTAFARRGLGAEYGLSWLLPRIMGVDKALDLLLSGRTIEADEAATLGLVTRVVEPDQLMDSVYAYAAELVTYSSPLAMMAIRRQVWSDLDHTRDAAMTQALAIMYQLNLDNPDFLEGVASFAEKRKPNFLPLDPNFRLVTEKD